MEVTAASGAIQTDASIVVGTTGEVDGNFSIGGAFGQAGSKMEVTASSGAIQTDSTITADGAIVGLRYAAKAGGASVAVLAAMSGGVLVNDQNSGQTTYTLPAAAAGLNFCFVEGGTAAGELLITPAADDAIIMKTNGAGGTALAPAASTGVKNDGGSNVKGDFVCLTAIDGVTWYATSVGGTWASQ
jgi:hypothetical protein